MGTLYHFLREHHVLAVIEVAAQRKLLTLNLSHFEITSVPSCLFQLRDLQNLYLGNNNISEISSDIGNLKNLTFLGLDYNHLGAIPKEIKLLNSKLTGLNLSCNPLHSLLPEIGHLQALSSLWLNHTCLTELPPEIGKLHLLDTFGARGNSISSLPNEFCNLISLRWLTLEGNLIEELPEDFKNLDSLIHLNLNKNHFKHVPECIQHLKDLRFCYLANNKISEVSTTFLEDLKHIRKLDLCGNKDLSVAPEIKQLYKYLCTDEDAGCFLLPNVSTIPVLNGPSIENMEADDDDTEWESVDLTDDLDDADDDITETEDEEEDWEESVPTSELDLSEISEGDVGWRHLDDEDDPDIVLIEGIIPILNTISSFIANGS